MSESKRLRMYILINKPKKYYYLSSYLPNFTDPSDYNVSAYQLTPTFTAGTSMVNVTVQITNDNIFEGTQSLQLSLESTSAPQVVFGAYNQTTVNIMDDEMITVSFSDHYFSAMESAGEVVVGVNASLPSGGSEVSFSVGTIVTSGTASGEEHNFIIFFAYIST